MVRVNDWVSPPADYAELVQWYKPFLINFLGQKGIVEDEREDVFQSILEKAITHDILAQFNGDRTFEYAGKTHRAAFKGFITSFFKSYIPGWLVRQNNRSRREPLIANSPATSQADEPSGADWITAFGPSDEDDFVTGLIGADTVESFRRHLRGLSPRSAGDQLDMLKFLDHRLDQVTRSGTVSNREVEIHFDRSHTCINGWTWRLRQEYCNWAGITLPPKKPSVPRTKAGRPVPPPLPCPPK